MAGVSKGMSETLLEDLRKGVPEFETSLEASRQGRRDHVGAVTISRLSARRSWDKRGSWTAWSGIGSVAMPS